MMEQFKDQILNHFLFSKDCKIFRIKVGGEFVTVNGKSVWHSIGAAKKALRYNSSWFISSVILREEGINDYNEIRRKQKEIYDEFLDWALKTKFIEFIEL